MIFVNYHRERAQLAGAATAEPAAPAATTFVAGPEESGKTALLQWFKATHGSANHVLYIDVADPSAAETPRGVMSRFVTEMNVDDFAEYWTQDGRNVANVAIIQGVNITGSRNEIKAVTGGVALPDQLVNLIPLTRAFIAGLKRASSSDRPIVLCVDGYSSTEELTRLWIRRQLARMMRPLPFARLVLAGRDKPDAELYDADEKLHLIELRGIRAVEDWRRAAEELGCTLASDPQQVEAGLRMVIDYANGQPGGIMSWLRSKARAMTDQ